MELNVDNYLSKYEKLIEELATSDIELRVVKDKLERISSLKDDFLHFCAHDLRGYLAAIGGLAGSMADDIFGPVTPEQKDALSRISKQCIAAMDFTATILDLGKFENDGFKLTLKNTDFAALARQVIDELKEKSDQQNIKLQLNYLSPNKDHTLLDRNLIRRVMYNLCKNAIKYSRQGCEIKIEAGLVGDYFNFNVHDCSDVIKIEEAGGLFDKYNRLAKAKGTAGWGIGLALCKKIIEMHKGTIGLRASENSKGNIFYFRIPREGAHAD